GKGFWRFAIRTMELRSDRSPELLRNGDFVTDAVWTIAGAGAPGWKFHGNRANINAPDGISNLRQTLSLVEGATYEAKMDVASVTTGQARQRLGGTTPVLGSLVSEAGEQVDLLVANDSSNSYELPATAGN